VRAASLAINAFVVAYELVKLMCMLQTRLTPSLLAWLRCFEATVRCRSFTKAAAELCVTQGAVSQQVKHLEDWLQRPLLLRTPRALVPTPEGQWLAVVLRESFQAIEGTLIELRGTQEDLPTALSCAPSFAMGWLTPRLGEFFRAHPEVNLRVMGEFHALDRERMTRDEVAAAVRYDLGQYRDLQATAFLDEWLIPVASPAFLSAHPQLRAAADLRAPMLLHDTSPWVGAGPFEEWEHWLEHVGTVVPLLEQGHHYNLSQLAIGAALAGQGIAMGRAALVFDDLAAGRLVAPFLQAVGSRASYFFVTGMDPSPHAALVQGWLTVQAARFRVQRDALAVRLCVAFQGGRSAPKDSFQVSDVLVLKREIATGEATPGSSSGLGRAVKRTSKPGMK
jgi:LysR family glycine cleavage system transcriptional activator